MSKKKWIIALCLVLILGLCGSYCIFNGGVIERSEESDDDDNSSTNKITSGGSYTFTGSIDGKIKVNAPGADVEIILAGVTITHSDGPCIKIEDAASVKITLQAGTTNYLYSGSALISEETGSAINSLMDFEIGGEGTLYAYGYSNNGIKSDAGITISGGNIYVESAGDGIQATTDLNITGGSVTVSAGDDGLHADENIVIDGGTVNITKSYEGIEAVHITVNGGDITVVASDDGFNACGGTNSIGGMSFGGRGGSSGTQGGTSGSSTSTELPSLTINDGNIYVIASGDGLDSNGDLVVNGGMVIVDGPSSSANGALDSGTENGGSLLVNGGTVLAIGASGMAETPESASECGYISVNATFKKGSVIKITKSDGTVLISHTAQTSGNSIIFASDKLESGETVTVSVNGSSVSATVSNGSSGGGSSWGGGGGFTPGGQGGGGFGPGTH